MSQHDYDIANQPGAAFRSDVNAAFLAIVSQNSGATQPATRFAYQYWADTTAGILKQRNAGNTAWISLYNLATGRWLPNVVVADRIDSGLITIASAAAPNIFGAGGNTINYTGAVTATSFSAAAKAGMERTLICAAGCKFTNSANLIIEGASATQTVTMQANAIVKVFALTTTKFKLTYSYSGSYVATGSTGFATPPTTTAHYTVVNGQCTINFGSLNETSNSGVFIVTGMPANIQPTNGAKLCYYDATDNGAAVQAYIQISTSQMFLWSSAGWTAAGSKGWSGDLTYRI